MKKSFLLICFLTLASMSFSQAKFYSNEKQVTELQCGMTDLKVVLPIPEEITNHELTEVRIDFHTAGDNAYRWARFYDLKEFKTEYLKDKKEITLWIKKAGAETGDFCSVNNCFKLDELCSATYRNYSTVLLSVRFYGKDVNGYKWVDNKQVPTYKISSTLKEHTIKMNFGDVIKKVSSKESTFTATKFSGPKYMSFITPEKDNDVLESHYSSTKGKDYQGDPVFENPIYFHIMVMNNKEDPSVKLSKEYVKHIFLLDLIKKANNYDDMNYSYLEKPKINYNNRYTIAIIKELQLDGKKKLANVKAEAAEMQNKLKNQEETIKWEKMKLGNLDVDMLKLKSYDKDDLKRGENDFWGIKPEAKANFYYFFVGEKDGKVVAGSFFRNKPQDLTIDEQQFIDHMLKTFEIK